MPGREGGRVEQGRARPKPTFPLPPLIMPDSEFSPVRLEVSSYLTRFLPLSRLIPGYAPFFLGSVSQY